MTRLEVATALFQRPAGAQEARTLEPARIVGLTGASVEELHAALLMQLGALKRIREIAQVYTAAGPVVEMITSIATQAIAASEGRSEGSMDPEVAQALFEQHPEAHEVAIGTLKQIQSIAETDRRKSFGAAVFHIEGLAARAIARLEGL